MHFFFHCSAAKTFDLSVLEHLMEPDYQLYPLLMSAADTGHAGLTRQRWYVILRHVASTDCLFDPFDLYERIRGYISERVQTQPQDYMIASQEEILLEAAQEAIKRRQVLQPRNMDLRYLLNDREARVLDAACREYETRFHADPYADANFVIFLGDNPEYSYTWSAVTMRIPTLRLNDGKLYFPFFRRWMVASERLACLGFPVRTRLSEAMGVPPLLIRDERRASQLAGNCMMLPCVAIAQMIGLACVASKQNTGNTLLP